MAKNMPIFDDTGRIFGTLTCREEKGRKRIFFKSNEGVTIEMVNMQRFQEYLSHREIPQSEIDKGIKFFRENLLNF